MAGSYVLRLTLIVTLMVVGGGTRVGAETVHGGTRRDGTVSVGANSPGWAPVVTASGSGGPVCTWALLHLDRDPGAEEFTHGDIPVSPAGIGPRVVEEFGGVAYTLYRVACSDGSEQDRWIPSGTTVSDLIPAVRDHASALIGLPVPDVNPPPASGIVNVGLWLAVEAQVVPPLSARAGDVWITLAPQLATTRYHFGNGDVLECEGAGVPIEDVHPDLDTVEQSPTCGYTYRRSSPDAAPYKLTVTTVWRLPYTSSSGPGSLAPMERSVTLDYDVDEIQTIGIDN